MTKPKAIPRHTSIGVTASSYYGADEMDQWLTEEVAPLLQYMMRQSIAVLYAPDVLEKLIANASDSSPLGRVRDIIQQITEEKV